MVQRWIPTCAAWAVTSTQCRPAQGTPQLHATYSDAKVANRDVRVWHFVIENDL